MAARVVLVAGFTPHDVADELWRAAPESVLVRHDLSGLADRVVRRWVDGALLAAIPATARRGEVDDGFGPLLYGQPPLESQHGVSVVHFTERRPFHPMRLHDSIDVLLDGVVRARGRVWLASQPDEALWLESAGGGLRVGNLGPWLAAIDDWAEAGDDRRAAASLRWYPYYGDRDQEIVVITRFADPEEIVAALRAALVTDEELALIAELDFADPFADWHEEMEL